MGTGEVFAVIAEGTRRQILETLRHGDRAVGELVVELHVSQPTVSKHLKVLREAGLVTMRAQGQKRYYALNAEPLDRVGEWLAAFAGDPRAGGAGEVDVVGDAADRSSASGGLGTLADVLTDAEVPGPTGDPEPDLLAAAVLAGVGPVSVSVSGAGDIDSATGGGSPAGADPARPIGRTMGRAAERAADLLSQLRRRRDPS